MAEYQDRFLPLEWGEAIQGAEIEFSYLACASDWPTVYRDFEYGDTHVRMVTYIGELHETGMSITGLVVNHIYGPYMNIFDFNLPALGNGVVVNSSRSECLDGEAWSVGPETGPIIVSNDDGQPELHWGCDYRVSPARSLVETEILELPDSDLRTITSIANRL